MKKSELYPVIQEILLEEKSVIDPFQAVHVTLKVNANHFQDIVSVLLSQYKDKIDVGYSDLSLSIDTDIADEVISFLQSKKIPLVNMDMKECGYGMGNMEKDPKKAFKGARWTVKYNEVINIKEVKKIIKELLREEIPKITSSQLTPDVIKQMRDWVTDCQWKESPEEIDGLSDAEIIRGVQTHYEGGVDQFIKDSNPIQKYSVSSSSDIHENEDRGTPLPNNLDSVINLVFNLKEGQAITFYPKPNVYNPYHAIEKRAQGDSIVYLATSGRGFEELEKDEDVSKNIELDVFGKYGYYEIYNIPGYTKKRPDPDIDDQSLGEYPFMDPQYPKPEY